MVAGKVEAPFGRWESPISINLLTGSAIAISDFKAFGENDLYFLESRPFEGGRTALVKMDGKGNLSDVVPKDANVRTRVHEYGGRGFAIDTNKVSKGLVYSNFKDSVLHYIKDVSAPEHIAPLTTTDKPLRFADYSFHPTLPLLIAVCEDHTHDEPAKVENYLVLINLEDKSVKSIVRGSDFYSNPIFSPDGQTLIWKEWKHPEMPWTDSKLFAADFSIDSTSISRARSVFGGTSKHRCAVTQPRFDANGTLFFASDATGYQQLYKSINPYESATPLTDFVKGDFAPNDWMFGNATYTVLSERNELIASYTSSKGLTLLARIDTSSGKLEKVDHPFLTIDAIDSNPAFPELVYITGSTREVKGLFSFYAHNGDLKVLRSSVQDSPVGPEFLSLAQPLEIPLPDGGKTYGFYYPPTSATHQAPVDTLPPLLMRIHGGPTSFSPPVTSLQISYWTSRGYGFFSLNYGGSSGFGREYMNALNSNWGIIDRDDAVGAATWLAANKYCDGTKMAIDGGSAGGYTVLNVLCQSSVFAAGCSLYGVSELTALAEDTHKFESQYLYNLIGGTPADVPDVYHDRSPLYHAKNIKVPVMVQQGTEDRVVPLNQAEKMVKEIESAGGVVELLVFSGEGHGFRGAEAQRQSLEGETKFFERYLRL